MNHRTVLAIPVMLMGMLLIDSCTTAYDIGNADPRVTPVEVTKDVAGMLNHTVAWGGLIIASKNLEDKSELELVGYPLDSEHRPNHDARSIGRFLVIQPGYLETADFAPGRLITVVGTVMETRTDAVGQTKYVYPVVIASKLHLWPKLSRGGDDSTFHFGLGVGIVH
ncbi:MAG: Slp family lipoprotein [Sulfuricaulis sp.]